MDAGRSPSAGDAARGERSITVDERLRRPRPEAVTRRWTVAGQIEERLYLQVVFPILVTLPLDFLLIGFGAPWISSLAWVTRIPAWVVVAGMAGLWLTNGALAVRLLGRFQGRASSPLTTLARGLLGGLPLLGFLWLPSVARIGSGSARRARPGAGRWRAGGLERLLRRWVEGSWWPLIWLFPVNLLALVLLALWLGPPAPGDRLVAAVAVSLVFHLVSTVAGWRWTSGRRETAAGRAVLQRLAVFSLLLPSPVGLLGLLFLLVRDQRRDGAETLVGKAGSRGNTLGVLPLWRDVARQLGRTWDRSPWWRRPFAPRGTEEVDLEAHPRRRMHLLAFARLKILVGFFEGYLVAVFLAHGLASGTTAERRAALVFAGGLGALLLVGGASYLATSLGRLAAAVRLRPRRRTRPEAWLATLAPLSVLVGFGLGRVTQTGSSRELALLWTLGAAIVAMLAAMRAMTETVTDPDVDLERGRGRNPAILWAFAILVGGALVGLAMAVGAEAAEAVRRGLVALAVLAPVAGAILGVASLPWLLQPLTPAVLLRPDRSVPMALVWAVVATAVLPLGALAAPLWLLGSRRFSLAARGD